MTDVLVAVRYNNGAKRIYKVNDARDAQDARETIYNLVSSVGVVLASVPNTKKEQT